MKRAWARHRRSRHRPRTFARRIDPAPVPVAAEPKSKPEPDRFARPREQLNALVAAARSKGLYAGDDAGFDRLLGQARGDRTAGALNRLDQFVRAFNADRRFAEAKLARLNRAIKKADLPADQRQQMGRLSQQILRAIIEGRYVQASKTMQFALKRLKSHGQ